MSNVIAGVIRDQYNHLQEHIAEKKAMEILLVQLYFMYNYTGKKIEEENTLFSK